MLREDEIKYDLESKRYAQMLSDNQTIPGTWNEDFLKAKERELNDTKRMLDIGKQAVANSSLVQGANALRDSSAALTRSGAQDIARAKENLGTLGRFAVDVGAAGTQLVGDAFLAGLTGGIGVLPVKAVQAFGSGAEQARAAGANLDQQAAYGLANAALNLGTEKLFNLATPLKKTYGAGLLESPLADTLDSFRETTPIQMGLSALTEGGEEFAEALAQPLFQRATYNPNAEFDLNDAFYQGFVGGTVGGLAGGADVLNELDFSDGFLLGFLGEDTVNELISDNDATHSFSFNHSNKNDPLASDTKTTERTNSDLFTDSSNIDIIKMVNGARITDVYDPVAEAHANRYYGLVRSMSTDVSKIAKNTGFSEELIQQIKNYIFIDVHDLGDSIPRNFDPSFAMAQSWQRLISGTPEPHDLTLLKHEKLEKELMDTGMSQYHAHIEASKKYNYTKESDAYYAALKKYKDRE